VANRWAAGWERRPPRTIRRSRSRWASKATRAPRVYTLTAPASGRGRPPASLLCPRPAWPIRAAVDDRPAASAPRPGGAGRTRTPAMTGQLNRAQRRRTTRSTTISTATSATIQTSTQIHSGMIRLLPRAGGGRTGCCHISPVVVAGGERPPRAFGAALRGPRPLRGPTRPGRCLLDGLPSLPRSGVKGRCALMSARWAFGPPLTPPRPGWAGDIRSPPVGEEQHPTSRQHEEAPMRQFEQDWLELGSRVARSLHYQARRWQRMAAWQQEAARRTP
jgi:hypothetical protein